MPITFDLRHGALLVAVLAVFAGCGRSTNPENADQIRRWRAEGRLAAGPWTEPITYGAHATTIDLLWVRHEARSGMISLVPVDNAAGCTLGHKAETDPRYARWASAPWDRLTDAARSRIPDGCFAVGKRNWGLALTSASGEQTFASSHVRSLGDGHTLVFGAPRGEHHLWEGAEAAVLDGKGTRTASWKIPSGSIGRIDFLGTLLLAVHCKDGATSLAILDPRTLAPLPAEAPLAIVIDDSFGATRTFTHLIVCEPSATTAAAKLVITERGPLELPVAYDRLLPYRLEGAQLLPTGAGDARWKVDAWLAERDGAIIAVLDRHGALLAGGLARAEPVTISGFLHAAGSPGSVPGFIVCDLQGQWRVSWLDGIEPSPAMAQRDWAISAASTQRSRLNVQSINAHNNRVLAETALNDARRAEAARLKDLAAAKAREYGQVLAAFEDLVALKLLGEALDKVEGIDRRAMHEAQPGRWEQACIACTRLALAQDGLAAQLRMRSVLGSIPMHPGTELARTLAQLDDRIYSQTAARHALPGPAAQAGGQPSSYVRELPGAWMRAMEGSLRRELESAGATYYAR